ncbi:unnamed protein product [Rotaria magnacalcarata]|uniref:Sorting nexin-2 n=7 Tax=Rotaria magnacalcarata TaxID=392030 RepID=A0A816CXS3_9BILA|nr:unnamed protein product [Rotaria magnacalcarata]CAF1628237.1 unnamed protein product [Rotaria magnacalcarata]CAF3781684.1 unnamed protein product [Rotaria magnacalcarata]CAF3809016.1 unnamed protein product [Rotaria magnacalcarata]
MSDDHKHRDSPPDFDDDDTKDDDQMFKSATLPVTDDIPLSEEDEEEEENPFGESSVKQKSSTNLNQSPTNNETPLNMPPVTPIVVSDPQLATSANNDAPLFSQDSNVNTTEKNTSTTQPVRSIASLENQPSGSAQLSRSINCGSSALTLNMKPAQKKSDEHNIEITVSDPTKVGEGMSSYMTYRITTKTTMAMFKKSEFFVNRRFSDFLGLHNKLVHKHLQLGVIIPCPPEKDTFVMAKVKISKDEAMPTDFIDRRRSQLERYLNRLARHSKLVQDPDFREFIEMPTELPKSSNTQALSGAGVLRALTNISQQVTKLTTKTSEQDQWFEEQHTFVLDLHSNFKHLHNHFNTLFSQRKEAAQALKTLSTSLNHLATIEEHTLLSSALIELANVQEKLEQINIDHSMKEYSIIIELIKEYLSLLEMVQLAFQERIKIHQQWLSAEETLRKKRESKTKLEQTPKGVDKIPQTEMEINEWEGKVMHHKEDFERISTSIREELNAFETARVEDFKKAIDSYLKELLEQQEKMLEVWEAYLPEANKINMHLIQQLVLFVILIHELSCQQSSVQIQKIEADPPNPNVGESLKIRCFLINVDPFAQYPTQVLWSIRRFSQDRDFRILAFGGSVRDTLSGRVSARKESEEVYEIVFRPIQESDSSVVRCELANTEAQVRLEHTINVLVPPSISFVTPDVQVRAGDPVTLECRAQGNPPPLLMWIRQGQEYPTSYSGIYRIESISKDDRGLYKCVAEQQTGKKLTAENYVNIFVDFEPTVICDQVVVEQVPNINADAEITCIGEAYPMNVLKWEFSQGNANVRRAITTGIKYRIDTNIAADSIDSRYGSRLIIKNVEQNDFGVYTLIVMDESKRQASAWVELRPSSYIRPYNNAIGIFHFYSYFFILFSMMVGILLQ